jgi:D-arabinose 1-dehydrogenase-like Zn-dependent alcohol dehydrogenase
VQSATPSKSRKPASPSHARLAFITNHNSFFPYFFNCYNLVTNLVASRTTHAEMLDFAAQHGVKPLIEEFAMDEEGVAEAIAKLKSGNLRYRAVLKL